MQKILSLLAFISAFFSINATSIEEYIFSAQELYRIYGQTCEEIINIKEKSFELNDSLFAPALHKLATMYNEDKNLLLDSLSYMELHPIQSSTELRKNLINFHNYLYEFIKQINLIDILKNRNPDKKEQAIFNNLKSICSIQKNDTISNIISKSIALLTLLIDFKTALSFYDYDYSLYDKIVMRLPLNEWCAEYMPTFLQGLLALGEIYALKPFVVQAFNFLCNKDTLPSNTTYVEQQAKSEYIHKGFKVATALISGVTLLQRPLYNQKKKLLNQLNEIQKERNNQRSIMFNSYPCSITFKNILGSQYKKIKKDLQNEIAFLKNPCMYGKTSKPSRGALLYGPPGVGKTLCAQAVAGEAKRILYPFTGGDLLDPNGIKKFEETCRKASKKGPSIIFIDELDSLIGDDPVCMRAQTKLNEVINGALFDTREYAPLYFMAAMNKNPKMLSPGLQRRFDKKIYLDLPTAQTRLEILEELIHDTFYTLDRSICLKTIAFKYMEGMNCDTIRYIVDEVKRIATYEGRNILYREDFENVLASLGPTS